MSFTLFCDNDKTLQVHGSQVEGETERGAVFWFSLRCNSTLMMFSRACSQQRWESLHILLSCLPALVSFKFTLQWTTALPATWLIALLIHCCIYCIHCWNYSSLNQSKQAERMKSSHIVASIIPIRFLLSPPSLAVPLLLQLNDLWPVAGPDRQIITLCWACQMSHIFTGEDRKSWEGSVTERERKREKRKNEASL